MPDVVFFGGTNPDKQALTLFGTMSIVTVYSLSDHY